MPPSPPPRGSVWALSHAVSLFVSCFVIAWRRPLPPAAAAVVVYVCVSAVSVCLGWCPVMCTTGIFCCCVVLHVVARARLYFLLPFFLVCCPSASPSFCLFVHTFFLSYFRRTGVGAAKGNLCFCLLSRKSDLLLNTHTYTQPWMSMLCYCSPIARGALGAFWCRGGPSAKDRAFPAFVPLSTLP